MSTQNKRPCRQCGVIAIPTAHRCEAKQAAIAAARVKAEAPWVQRWKHPDTGADLPTGAQALRLRGALPYKMFRPTVYERGR